MPDDSQDGRDLISGGHLVAKALKAEGVEVIYTLCGGHIIDIYDGCVDEGIDVVDVRHEQVAAHAADGAFSLTGWDFETLVRYDLPFVGIVGNNSSDAYAPGTMNQTMYK